MTPGTLWPATLARTASARAADAILSIPTEPVVIEETGVLFQVRVMKALARKALAASAQTNTDPFLPYDPALFVADLSPTHVALLNKFTVVDHHLLMVTRAFEEQTDLLTLEDCEALRLCLAEIDGLAFYNAGPAAGASQRHKHLQLIPLSVFPDRRVPMAPLLAPAQSGHGPSRLPGLPFLHAYTPIDEAWLDPRQNGASALLACYQASLRATGLSDEQPSAPYNLLVTRQWLLVVPRSQEYCEGVSVNALGFAGALLVKDASQLAAVKQQGPLAVLRHVTYPRTG